MDGRPTPAHGARCHRCGSDRLRRSHSRTSLQKLLRRTTLLDRYACGACGQRGWTWGRLPARGERPAGPAGSAAPGGATAPARPAGPASAPGPAHTPTTGRRLERRDHRLRRRVRLRGRLTVAASLALGIVVALYLQRCGGTPPPVE